jgi:DNA-directed RNA polymerase subunit H
MQKKDFDIKKHELVPKHAKASEKEKKEILEKYNISVYDLPYIKKNDPAIAELEASPGDIVKIIRKSPTAGVAVFYRCVVNV